MASQGHIKIDRRILNWEWYRDSNMVHVFLHLLLTANYSDSRFQGFLVKRGQLITGRLKLATTLGLTEMQIRTCLNKLKSTNEITIKSTNKFSIITICKYDSYQSNSIKDNQQNNQQDNQRTTNEQPTNNQQTTTSNNNKEEKEFKEEKEIKEETLYAFDSELFKKIWGEWVCFRKEKKQTLTASTIKKQNAFLSKYTQDVAIGIIEKSITNGWVGLFEPKEKFNNGKKEGLGKNGHYEPQVGNYGKINSL